MAERQPYSASPLSENREIVQRLSERLERTELTRTELLEGELVLRGMLPMIEEAIPARMRLEGEFAGVEDAEVGLQELTTHLMWIQLHSLAPLGDVRARLQAAMASAALALRGLASGDGPGEET
jgi:hypothetical protein